jgi:hypothetical protein
MRALGKPASELVAAGGIGEGTARRIHDTLDINTLEELETAAHDGWLAHAMGGKRDPIDLQQTIYSLAL